MSDKLLERIAVALEKLAGKAPLPSTSTAATTTAPKSTTKEPPAGKGAAAPGKPEAAGLRSATQTKPPAGGKLDAAREAVIGWLRKVKAAAGGAAAVGRILTEAGASNIGTLKLENFDAVIEACKQELEDAPAGDATEGL